MDSKENYTNLDNIKKMLYGDETYIKEFADAAIQSFEEFSGHYSKYLLNRDETNFRKAGHKIKPVALMLHIQEIVDEYERAKKLLQNDGKQEELKKSERYMSELVNRIVEELKEIA